MPSTMATTVEQAVLGVFRDTAGEYQPVMDRLVAVGWSRLEADHPITAWQMLFRVQGLTLAQTDCLDRIMLAELAAVLSDRGADGVVLPSGTAGLVSASGAAHVAGVVLGPLRQRRLAVAVALPLGRIAIGIAEAGELRAEQIDFADPTVQWSRVTGQPGLHHFPCSTEWHRAMAAAHRALATEIAAVTDAALQILSDHHNIRPATALAARQRAQVLLDDTWRYGGRLSAVAAKAAAGRAHHAACAVAAGVQDDRLRRYLQRGVQLDTLCGSARELETVLADRLFEPCSAPVTA